MKINCILRVLALLIISLCSGFLIHAQQYVSPIKPAEPGKAPGLKLRLVDSNAQSKTYVLIFAHGDEVVSGLTGFAADYHIKSASYTAIGDASSARLGWYDYDLGKMFKVDFLIDSPCEVTSLIGDMAVYNGKAVAHSHVNVATEDGISHGGHLIELRSLVRH